MVKPSQRPPENALTDLIKFPPGKKYWVSEPDATREILFSETGAASKKGSPSATIVQIFDRAVKLKGDKVTLRTENLNKSVSSSLKAPPALPLLQWQSWTWTEYLQSVRLTARGMLSLGFNQHDCCCVVGFNSPEWFIAGFASIFAGGKLCGMYPTDSTEQILHKSFDSNCSIAFVEVSESLQRFRKVIDELPYLKAIVCWGCEPCGIIKRSDGTVCKTLSFSQILSLGKKYDDAKLNDCIAKIRPEHCCVLVYTSGTTGKPKAVMLSHDNILYETLAVLKLAGIGTKREEERLVSYLPLSHIAGLGFDAIQPLIVAACSPGWTCVSFARNYDLKIGTLAQRMVAVQPTVFLGVPRIWEKIEEKLRALGASSTGLRKKLVDAAKPKGLRYQENLQLGGSGKKPIFYGVCSSILSAIKNRLGLGKCKYACSGAAPLKRSTLSYFGSLGINIHELYGMTESCSATTVSSTKAHLWGTVGFALPGVEIKCFKVGNVEKYAEAPFAKDILDPKEEEQGEICFRGRNIMMGYLSQPLYGEDHVNEIAKKNEEAIDDEGWLHSGDKGCISETGMISITGRFKELIIGAGGENIAPVAIEDNMKTLCPFISNIMMYGDKQKFCVCIITLTCEGSGGDTISTNKLSGIATKYGETVEDACTNPRLISDITDAIKETGRDGLCTPTDAAKIQKFSILPIDFSVESNELTPTLKLKRFEVEKRYKDIFSEMYRSNDIYVPYPGI